MIAIQGVGVVGGFGSGLEELNDTLLYKNPRTQHVQVKTSDGIRHILVYFADTARLEDFLNTRILRRVHHYSKMALLGAHLAIQDAGELDGDRSRMGIIVASGYGPSRTTSGFLDTFIDDGYSFSSPIFFSNSVQNAAVANISLLLTITGPGLTVSQLEMSFPSALITAKNWLEEGRVDSVLLGAVDEYHDALGYYWHSQHGEPTTADHEIRPFEFDLQTAVPGEGAIFFLLKRADDKSPSRYGYIEDVLMGRCERSPLTVTDNTFLFVGADGNKDCGDHYKKYIPEHARAVSYTPVYGSLPIGPAFDMAIAALSRKSGTLCGPPAGNIAATDMSMDKKHIQCLKINKEGQLGIITLVP